MKYKCFCEKDFFDLTREEVRHMLRTNKSFTPKEFAKHYKVDAEKYCDMIRAKGMNLTREDRKFWTEHRERLEKKNNANPKANNISYNPFAFGEIPKVLICALYEIDFEVINGKRYYDIEQFERAKEDVENKLAKYQRILTSREDTNAYSKWNHMDLVAVRIYRGMNRQRFSKESGLTLNMIKEYESKGSKIPGHIERAYRTTLGVKDRHVIQLREIMTGKSKNITDDREIPKIIKLKVWKRDKGKCSECCSDNKLHYHHIKRFSEGGQHTEENLKLLCAKCHAEEHKGEKAYHMLKKLAED